VHLRLVLRRMAEPDKTGESLRLHPNLFPHTLQHSWSVLRYKPDVFGCQGRFRQESLLRDNFRACEEIHTSAQASFRGGEEVNIAYVPPPSSSRPLSLLSAWVSWRAVGRALAAALFVALTTIMLLRRRRKASPTTPMRKLPSSTLPTTDCVREDGRLSILRVYSGAVTFLRPAGADRLQPECAALPSSPPPPPPPKPKQSPPEKGVLEQCEAGGPIAVGGQIRAKPSYQMEEPTPSEMNNNVGSGPEG
jgi:hypothetical protein